ncbi:MAG: DUF1294 domain-containing protein [Tissierellia bacterium]|nr:DUF1294 domain-containing protein [Tissierellia bacterium]
MPYNREIFLYFLGINTLNFLLFLWDKRKAVKKKWRISEKVLLLFSVLGGFIGGAMAMILGKHKLSKKKFYRGIPIIAMIYALIFLYYILNPID